MSEFIRELWGRPNRTDFARKSKVINAVGTFPHLPGQATKPRLLSQARGTVRVFPGFQHEFINVHIARRNLALSGSDADDGLLEIFVLEADVIKPAARAASSSDPSTKMLEKGRSESAGFLSDGEFQKKTALQQGGKGQTTTLIACLPCNACGGFNTKDTCPHCPRR